MSEDKPIKRLEIIEDYGDEGDSFNDSWLDLSDENANVNIVRNFGWMQRKINELVEAVNATRKIGPGIIEHVRETEQAKVLEEMERLLPKSVADQLHKTQEQSKMQMAQDSRRAQKRLEEERDKKVADKAVLLAILERERVALHNQVSIEWDPTSMAHLRSVERLIEAAREKS